MFSKFQLWNKMGWHLFFLSFDGVICNRLTIAGPYHSYNWLTERNEGKN